MAISTQLYRFHIELADITRSVYESLDFRLAQHPSESMDYLLTRMIAYVLNIQEGLKFSSEGLHNPEDPTLSIPSSFGGEHLWIEIGNPSARKLHKAAKAAKHVQVFTYKNPAALVEDIKRNNVHRASEIEIFALNLDFLDSLTKITARDNRWSLTRNDGTLMVTTGDTVIEGELLKIQ